MIDRCSYPALYRVADNASLNAQRRYLRLLQLDLGALVLGALLTALPFAGPRIQQWLAAAGTLLLVISVIITAVIAQKNYEEKWYNGRALAESVKTLSWKYMVGAEPFEHTASRQKADQTFRSHLRDVLEQAKQLSVPLGGKLAAQPQITDEMREVRDMDLEKRKSIYKEDRIHDQRQWYGSKSSYSKSARRHLFSIVVLSQIFAVVCGIAAILWAEFPLGFVGVFSASAAALIAWLQVKRHQELSQAYGIAAQDLGLISEELDYLDSDDNFAEFVADAEAAISREHTLWAARRGISLRNPWNKNPLIARHRQ